MNTDIRVDVGFLDHWKTDTLISELGESAVLALMRIWIFAAQNKPDGMLTGIQESTIARIAKWRGEPGSLTNLLVELRFIEKDESGVLMLRDWEERQPESMRRHRYEQSGGYDENGNRLFPDDWQDIKAAVYRRDGRQCQYCGTTDGQFHVDHIVPRIKGGQDTLDNLVVACASCNLSKGSKSASEWMGIS